MDEAGWPVSVARSFAILVQPILVVLKDAKSLFQLLGRLLY